MSAIGRTAIRLAYNGGRLDSKRSSADIDTYIFDVWARVDCDDISVLHPQVVSDHSIYPCRAIIELIICQDDQDGVLSLLALYQDCVATEQLKCFHGVVGECDNGVVIVYGVGDADGEVSHRMNPWIIKTSLTSTSWASSSSLEWLLQSRPVAGQLRQALRTLARLELPPCAQHQRGPWGYMLADDTEYNKQLLRVAVRECHSLRQVHLLLVVRFSRHVAVAEFVEM